MSRTFDLPRMTDKLLGFLTKDIATYDNTLINIGALTSHIKLSDPRVWVRSDKNRRPELLGPFTKLPAEVIFTIFSMLPIDCIIRVRQMSSACKALVESWPPFRTAMMRSRPAVRALLATTASRHWTFTNLLQLMYTSKCELCGAHGEILHLLQLKRTCFRCLTVDRRLLVVTRMYAYRYMCLDGHELLFLPCIRGISPQRVFGFTSDGWMQLFNYQDVLERSLRKYRRAGCPLEKEVPQSAIMFTPEIEGLEALTGFLLPTFVPHGPARASLYLRRALKYLKSAEQQRKYQARYRLPSFLLIPPESSYIQHLASVYFPARTPKSPHTRSTIISAHLCAGCSFYFNYHTLLPHQTHTLYPHPHGNSSRLTSIANDSPFTDHLKSCIYAAVYLRANFYPLCLNPSIDSGNPNLTSLGGVWTSSQMRDRREQFHTALSAPEPAMFRHFPRHPYDDDGVTPTSPELNNADFEMIPVGFLDLAGENDEALLWSRKGTDLELQLETKLVGREGLEDSNANSGNDRNDEEALNTTAMVSPNHDWEESRFDLWTRNRLIELKHMHARGPSKKSSYGLATNFANFNSNANPTQALGPQRNFIRDEYGDYLLQGSLDTVSQVSWATARASSSSFLFGGWTGLLWERKRQEEQRTSQRKSHRHAVARMLLKEYKVGLGTDEIKPGEEGWGLDRFGCVNTIG